MYLLISLRLNFGGANRLAEWSIISKKIADLENALLLDNTWEPQENQALPQDSTHTPSTQYISVLFSQSKSLAFDIPVYPQRKIDIYLENCIIVIPNIGNNRARGNTAMPLAIHAVSHPLSQKEPVPREKLLIHQNQNLMGY